MDARAQVKFAFLPSTAFLMAAIAGFTDVIGFIGFDKLFTAHITGNIVIAIAQLIHHEPGIASKVISIPLFIAISILLTGWIEIRGQSKRLLAFCFFLEALLLAGFMFIATTILPLGSVSSALYVCTGMLAVAAMAIHNTLLRTFMTTFPPCTVMTGNLTQIIIDTVSYSWGWKEPYALEKRGKSLSGIQRFGNVLVGFLLGGAIAALGYIFCSFAVVCVPVIALVYMGIKAVAY